MAVVRNWDRIKLPCVLVFIATLICSPAYADLYWSDPRRDQILTGVLTPGGSAQVLFERSDYPTNFATVNPTGLAVDSTYVYWADGSAGELFRGRRDGQGEVIALTPGRSTNPIAMSQDRDYLYWAERREQQIVRLRKDGPSSPEILYATETLPEGMDVDGEYIYWSEWATGRILRAPLAGGGSVTELYTGGFSTSGIDVSGDDLYWTNPFSGEVLVGAKDGGSTPSVLFSRSNGLDAPRRVLADANYLYVTDSRTELMTRANRDGTGQLEPLYGRFNYSGSGRAAPGYISFAFVPEPTTLFCCIIVGICAVTRRSSIVVR